MKKLNIEYIDIENINPYESNTRVHEEYDISRLKKSIQKYGFNDPVGIWSDKNIIVEGHGRVIAAKELGITSVPCIRLDHLSDEERREYGIMHNKTAELSKWDFDALAVELETLDLTDFDVSFNIPEFTDNTRLGEFFDEGVMTKTTQENPKKEVIVTVPNDEELEKLETLLKEESFVYKVK